MWLWALVTVFGSSGDVGDSNGAGGEACTARFRFEIGKLCGLVAAALPARDRAAVVPFNRGSLHAAALSWADGDTT